PTSRPSSLLWLERDRQRCAGLVQLCPRRLEADQGARKNDVAPMRPHVHEELVARLAQADVTAGRERQRDRETVAATGDRLQKLRPALEVNVRWIVVAIE